MSTESYPKEDPRISRTYKLLSDTILKLLTTTPFDEISVKEICHTAGVNRSTFYAHFEGKDHLLAYAMMSIISEATDMYFESDDYNNLLLEVLTCVDRFRLLFSAILLMPKNARHRVLLQERVAMDLKDKIRKRDLGRFESGLEPAIAAQFYAGAILSVLSWWLSGNEQVSLEEMAVYIQKLLKSTLHGFMTSS